MDKNYFIKLTLNLYRLTLLFPKKDPLRYKMRELGVEISASSILIFEKDFLSFEDLLSETKEQIEILDCFFEVVKNLNWVSVEKIFEIQKEYDKIKKELTEFLFEKEKQLNFDLVKNIQSEEKTIEDRAVENSFFNLETKKEKDLEKKIISMDKDLIGAEEFVKIEDSVSLAERKVSSFENPFQGRKDKILEILKQREKAQVGDFKEVFPEVSKRTLRRDFKSLMEEGLVERMGEKSETFYKIK
ncbi:MAG: DeoR family transcriptional regulator [Candidatus Nealsonbacteria bacterium]|nr:DeoR family transcriptional regulator [Candidatus Nealsonbacteria bacterium]